MSWAEAALVLSVSGEILFEHTPPGRSAGFIPDSLTLWQTLWDNRARLLGVAHLHPGAGLAACNPSHEDLTTFAAVERGLGKRLVWPIASSDVMVPWGWSERHGRYCSGGPAVEWPWFPWVRRLRELATVNAGEST